MFARSYHLQTMYEIVLSVCCFTLWWFSKWEANVGSVSLRSWSRLWESKIFMLQLCFNLLSTTSKLRWPLHWVLTSTFLHCLSSMQGHWKLTPVWFCRKFSTPYSFRTHLISIPSGQLKSGTSQLNVLRYTSIKEAISSIKIITFPCTCWLSHQSCIRLRISSNMSSSCTLAFSLKWSSQV